VVVWRDSGSVKERLVGVLQNPVLVRVMLASWEV